MIANNILSNILIGFIRLYQLLLSPYLGGQCRFYPTCSHYAIDAIRVHGPWIGIFLIMKRLSRCHPFGGHGVDFVPLKVQNKKAN